MDKYFVLEKYLEYLKKVKLSSPLTIKTYNRNINLYFSYLESNFSDVPFNKVNSDIYKKFYEFLINKNYSVSSIKLINISIRNFIKYYNDYVSDKKTRVENYSLSIKKKPKRMPEFFTDEEITNLLNLLNSNRRKIPLKNRYIIKLLLFTGIRVSELINIKKEDVFLEKRFIKIIGKGNKTRFVIIPKNLVKTTKYFLQTNSTYLIENRFNKQITSRGIEFILEHTFKSLNLDSKVFPHKFRHSYATMLLNETDNLVFVSKMLGHSSIQTTEIYTHMQKNKIKEILNKISKNDKNI